MDSRLINKHSDKHKRQTKIKMEELYKLQKDIKRYTKLSAKYGKLIIESITKFKELCPHKKVRKETKYYEGSYLNRSYSEYWYVCETCNTIVKKEDGTIGGYG